MIIVAEELKEKKYFDSFEEVVKYYNLEEELPQDLDEIEDLLKELHAGEEHPKFTLLNSYEVEYIEYNGRENRSYFDTEKEARKYFKEIIDESKEAYEYEEYLNEYDQECLLIKSVQLNKWNEHEESEMIDFFEFN